MTWQCLNELNLYNVYVLLYVLWLCQCVTVYLCFCDVLFIFLNSFRVITLPDENQTVWLNLAHLHNGLKCSCSINLISPYFYRCCSLPQLHCFSVAPGSLCPSVSVRFLMVYLSCSLYTGTSSRHAYFLCTWMAISAALPITIIYIKFEINFTLFSLCNYVNSCCETKLHTWILIAVSFKSLWTLERKTQHYGNISVISLQGFSVREGRRKLIIKYPLFESRETTELSLDPSVHPSVCQPLNTETCLKLF